ncbi:MAG: RNA polymerase sigma-54 factor [Planctomycetota bacterium]
MNLGLHQSARLEQRLIQSPQMIQAMQILQLGALDLQERIEQELVENPFLERPEPEGDEGRAGDKGADDSKTAENKDQTESWESMFDDMERLEPDFGNGRNSHVGAGGEDGDRKYEALQNTAAKPHSQAENLMESILLMELDPRDAKLVNYLVFCLDERGYLRRSRTELALEMTTELNDQVYPEEIELALEILRSATHPAMGAASLEECLSLQLLALGAAEDSLEVVLVSTHLGDLQANRLPRIAKATGSSIPEIKLALEEIRGLDPSPAWDYSQATAETIHPEVIVGDVDGKRVVRLDRERSPALRLSPNYRRMLEQAGKDPEAKAWIKKRVESASWFLDAVKQRESTLLRISKSVFTRQAGFLDKGVSGLQTLRMQEVADELGLHISTISRGVSGKHVQTSRGIFPLKYFFTGGTAKDTGEVASQASVKELVRKLIEAEDKKKPLSDDHLAAQLEEKEGIKIARRTVTKYRKGLNIPSSTQRRAY